MPRSPGTKPARTIVAKKLADDLPNRLDAHVGNRLRVRRMLAGLTQEELAAAVGITFQQVQKYEKGANRISASRLHAFAKALRVRVGWFFDDADSATGRVDSASDATEELSDTELLGGKEALELVGAYWRIRSPEKREALLMLIRKVSG